VSETLIVHPLRGKKWGTPPLHVPGEHIFVDYQWWDKIIPFPSSLPYPSIRSSSLNPTSWSGSAITFRSGVRCGAVAENARYCIFLLIAPSVSVLQKLLLACEKELYAIDRVINVKKSSCLRVGPRHKVTCAEITTSDGNNLPWVNEIRYLGIFYHASNAVFAKVGRFASEENWSWFCKKCLPVLTYGLEMCALPKRVLQSLDFTVNRVLMKLFYSSNIVVIEQCRYFFHIELPSVGQPQRCFEKFLANAADDDKVY